MKPDPVLARLAAMKAAPVAELKKQWRELFSEEPPAFNRRYLESRLAYRIQELAYGGLRPETRKRLEALGERLDGGNAVLRRIRDQLAAQDINLPDLSMGMSADYPAAVAEGATLVRIGMVGLWPERLLATTFITIAPPALVGLSGAVLGAPWLLVHMAWGVALFFTLLSMTVFRRSVSQPFGVAMWGMSFPLSGFAALTLFIAPDVAWRGVASVMCDAPDLFRSGPQAVQGLIDAYYGYRGITAAGMTAASEAGLGRAVAAALDAATEKAITFRVDP